MPYICPVCAFDNLTKPTVDFSICPCCATEFGYDDVRRSYDELRADWIDIGARWFSQTTPTPAGWNAHRQLSRHGYAIRS